MTHAAHAHVDARSRRATEPTGPRGRIGGPRAFALTVAVAAAALLPGVAGCRAIRSDHPRPSLQAAAAQGSPQTPTTSGVVTIAGDVRERLDLPIPAGGLTLAEALSRAGGFVPQANGLDRVALPGAPVTEGPGDSPDRLNRSVERVGRAREVQGETRILTAADELVALERKAGGQVDVHYFPLVMVQRDRAGQIVLRDGDLIRLLPAQDTSLFAHAATVAQIDALEATQRTFSLAVQGAAPELRTTGPGVQRIEDVYGEVPLANAVVILRRVGANQIGETFVFPISSAVYDNTHWDAEIPSIASIQDGDKFEITLLERLPLILNAIVRQTVPAQPAAPPPDRQPHHRGGRLAPAPQPNDGPAAPTTSILPRSIQSRLRGLPNFAEHPRGGLAADPGVAPAAPSPPLAP